MHPNKARSRKAPLRLTSDQVAGLLHPFMSIYIQGLASNPAPFIETLEAHQKEATGLCITGVLPPGMPDIDYSALPTDISFEGPFPSPIHQRSALEEGRARLLPLSYHGTWRWLGVRKFDWAILHLSPPDMDGRCSLGVTADFAEAAVFNAKAVLAYVNTRMPRTAGPAFAWDEIDYYVEVDRDLPILSPTTRIDDVSAQIAAHIRELIRDGDCLQVGIGSVPSAVLRSITDHRDLGYHGGLITDDILPLLNAGVLTGAYKQVDRGLIVTGAAMGTAALYEAVSSEPFHFRNSSYTHDPRVIGAIDNFVAINSAIQVDLLGQINSEAINGLQISGCGGLPDFTRGANLSDGGRAIIAMPSVTKDGASKIVSRLSPGTPITIPRSDPVIVVTEHGIADLRMLDERQRADRLISVAAPKHRETLKCLYSANC